MGGCDIAKCFFFLLCMKMALLDPLGENEVESFRDTWNRMYSKSTAG